MNLSINIMLEALAPGILVLVAAAVALPWLRPSDERARAVMAVILIALMWRYMLWRWTSTLPDDGYRSDLLAA